MSKCNHTTYKLVWRNHWDEERGYTLLQDWEEVYAYEDIDLHRYRCTECGEVGYYSGRAKAYYEGDDRSDDTVLGLGFGKECKSKKRKLDNNSARTQNRRVTMKSPQHRKQKMSSLTQNERIVKWLSRGRPMTVAQMRSRGISNPRARICELREEGHQIVAESVRNTRRMAYSL